MAGRAHLGGVDHVFGRVREIADRLETGDESPGAAVPDTTRRALDLAEILGRDAPGQDVEVGALAVEVRHLEVGEVLARAATDGSEEVLEVARELVRVGGQRLDQR